jgi:two-component system, NarL family, sensor histidine kinase UhpB
MRPLLIIAYVFATLTAFGQPRMDSLQKIMATEKGDEQLKALQALINEYSRTNLAKAKAQAHDGVLLATGYSSLAYLSGFYTQLVSLHQNTGSVDSVQFYLAALQRLSTQTSGKEKEIILANYYSASGLFHKKQGNYKAAIPFMLKAVALAKVVSTPEATAGQYLNIGNTFMNVGDFKNALAHHLMALRLFETAQSKKGISFSYQGIGEDFIELKRYDKALPYIKKSLELKTELGDKRGCGNALSAMGRIYLGLKNYQQSLVYLAQALSTVRELKLVIEEAKLLLNVGQVYSARNEADLAIDYFRQGKQLATETGDASAIAVADREIFALENKHKQKSASEKQLLSHILTTQSNGNKKEELSVYKALSDFYAKNGEPGKSLLYTAKYYHEKDSLLSKEIQLEISRLEEQYKQEKKEAEITLLKKDQQIIHSELKSQQQIQWAVIAFAVLLLMVAALLVNRYKVVSRARRTIEMEKMRNTIAKDLHDDIGSTLSSINIMSKVLLQQANDGVTDVGGLQKIKNHSAAIMESMSDIVWAINPHNDTGEKMMFKMKEFAAEILEPLDIHFTFREEGNVSELKLDPQKRRDLFLIFKESINNAAKYSHCKNIDIFLSSRDHRLEMRITDDGRGFDRVTAKQGNGLRNLQERTQSAGGSLSLKSGAGAGTAIQLQMPIT